MKKRLTQHLMENNSYFKWSATRLATKFNCSERLVKNVLTTLSETKTNYLNSLKHN